jgi:hypothetical protein
MVSARSRGNHPNQIAPRRPRSHHGTTARCPTWSPNASRLSSNMTAICAARRLTAQRPHAEPSTGAPQIRRGALGGGVPYTRPVKIPARVGSTGQPGAVGCGYRNARANRHEACHAFSDAARDRQHWGRCRGAQNRHSWSGHRDGRLHAGGEQIDGSRASVQPGPQWQTGAERAVQNAEAERRAPRSGSTCITALQVLDGA